MAWSKTLTFFEDAWHEGNVPIMGARTHGAWLGTSVFDGARAFEGVTPDLDLHCARINKSAAAMGLKQVVSADGLDRDLPARASSASRVTPQLYIRPLYWAEDGAAQGVVQPDPEFDALVPDAFYCADAEARRHVDHPVAVSQAVAR